MFIKSTFIATVVAAGALFFGGTTASEAGPRISFQISSGGYHGGHGGGYYRGGCAPHRPIYRRPVYHYRQPYHRPSYHYRQPCYRPPRCRY